MLLLSPDLELRHTLRLKGDILQIVYDEQTRTLNCASSSEVARFRLDAFSGKKEE